MEPRPFAHRTLAEFFGGEGTFDQEAAEGRYEGYLERHG
jgi:hypothetical protein